MARKKKSEDQFEAEVAKRHATIFKQRQEELKAHPLRDLPSLVKQMKEMSEYLDKLPDGLAYSTEDIDNLDDCRHECHSLKCMAEALLEAITGQKFL